MVVRDPKWVTGQKRYSPGIRELSVGILGDAGGICNQVSLFISCLLTEQSRTAADYCEQSEYAKKTNISSYFPLVDIANDADRLYEVPSSRPRLCGSDASVIQFAYISEATDLSEGKCHVYVQRM
jgi:hypothetical protein